MNKELIRHLLKASIAHDSMLEFMRFCWLKPNTPLITGKHTEVICKEIDKAIENYRNGISSYIEIVVPFRHGKSDISSRYLPAYFMGNFPDDEIIQTSYAASLSQGFSRNVESIIKSELYRDVFPQIELDSGLNNITERHIKDSKGGYYALGAEGGATGKGANLLIVDDFFKDRAEAESEVIRAKRWEAFSQVFMSRLAPVHIVLVLNTRWHIDDISGNIHNLNDSNHKNYDPDFPEFKKIHFKARQDDGTYLFPERFSEKWYKAQFAAQGKYGAAANLQGEPEIRGGNMLNVGGIQFIEPSQYPPNLKWVRFWDLASTEKERAKDDPDYTAGAKVAVTQTRNEAGTYVYSVYVDDVAYCQKEAGERNKLILQTSEIDGPHVPVGVEAVAGYKDTYSTIRDVLKGSRVVRKIPASKEKVVRVGALEPCFDACHVYFRRGTWNDLAYKQCQSFPSGSHDDIPDAIAGGFEMAKTMVIGNRLITV